jgi:ADP-ribosylglycohydrolase
MINKYNGCLLGLAIGDALGAPVEHLSLSDIKRKYGEKGITDFDAWDRFRPGSYSEDTQMSLVTAIGCIKAYQNIMYNRGYSSTDIIYRGYLEWLHAQRNPFWLRYTGNTIQSALENGRMGTIENPINDSKDCNALLQWVWLFLQIWLFVKGLSTQPLPMVIPLDICLLDFYLK